VHSGDQGNFACGGCSGSGGGTSVVMVLVVAILFCSSLDGYLT
jgi:hypothetical protein